MNSRIFAVSLTIIIVSLYLYKDVQFNSMVMEYESQLAVERTLYNACDARLMYLDQVINKNQIYIGG